MIDQHVHFLSYDAEGITIENLKEKRKELGFEKILITDHFELAKKRVQIPEFEYLNSLDDDFLVGAEIGYSKAHIEEYNSYIEKYKLNTVLMSVHEDSVRKIGFYRITEESPKNLVNDYYDLTLEAVSSNLDYDILTHIGFIFRMNYRENFYDYDDKIKPILEVLIKRNKTIEVNTSCFYYYKESIYKYYEHVLKMYKQMGGKNVSIGSDAHNIDTYGLGFEKTKKLLNNCGFDEIVVIKDRKITYEAI